jgi:tRNA pseudouridine55 synthase
MSQDDAVPSPTVVEPPCGVLIVAKPAGPTSHDIVALVRRLSGLRRVGHGGTLDPFASGVLPVFLGRATRMVEYHLGDAKEYRAIACFGARSTTDDPEGELTPGEGSLPGRDDVAEVLPRFTGRITQRPPDYSAVKVAGRRAYELARRGQRPEVRDREVDISSLNLAAWDEVPGQRPCATLEIRCAAGTYVRALARDLGDALGCGAYLASLVRVASGPFRLESALSLDELRTILTRDDLARHLLPPDAGLEALPAVSLSGADRALLVRGQSVRAAGLPSPLPDDGGPIRVIDERGRLIAMARAIGGLLRPDKVLVSVVPVPAAPRAAFDADA